MTDAPSMKPYDGPAGGWGSVRSLGSILSKEGIPASGTLVLTRQNKPRGFQCVSCAWMKPADPHVLEFCENGAKATAWEITTKRIGPDFFAAHTCAELERWTDHDLEAVGRITEPLRYDRASDTYVPVGWDEAFRDIGQRLQAMTPANVVLYASGRASLETSYMWALFARMYGTNNLPDSSNMCHEPTSVALPESIGAPKGTVTLDDFDHADLMIFCGQNPGTNSPRMLNELQKAHRRGAAIITLNPLRERALEKFRSPQGVAEMLGGIDTPISSQYHQVRIGGDIAALVGVCKHVLALDDAAQAAGLPRVLDAAFIDEHTHGLDTFAAAVREHSWDELERRSGITRGAMEAIATVYARSTAAIGIYGMGLTQHRTGVENVQMFVNLLLLRGNMGKRGAGICPVRGHSNVQGQRTVGITEKPELAPLDLLRDLYGFEPPRATGMHTVDACEAVLADRVEAFIELGGNFIRAVPETAAMERHWRDIPLTVMISTKLNRNHVIHGRAAYILPCRGRIEVDMQATGPQSVTVEDTSGCIQASHGIRDPASPHLLSEPAIVAGIAQATLRPNPAVPWSDWVGDYSLVRDAIERTYPHLFADFNRRVEEPGGFHLPNTARKRDWKTPTGRATFIVPKSLNADIEIPAGRRDVLQLMTVRSNDQFNTTIYGYHDRFRGVRGTRMTLFMHVNDIERLSLAAGDFVALNTETGDAVVRRVEGFIVTPYDIPEGCMSAYFPEANPLIPIWHHAEGAGTPAAKSIPVSVHRLDRPPVPLAAE
ncbi:MAG: FdhF/YdeP family oxidoreductase [Gemmatimonadaceae bacterium]|nr:FdhF/YdeP family oxidoreductase [Acetobacteraceae bacterium]